MTELRLRTRAHPDQVAAQLGKVLGPRDFDVLLTGPCRVLKPDGRPLAVYLPGWVADQVAVPELYDVLHSLRTLRTDNRGKASGTQRVTYGEQKRSRSRLVASTIVGALDARGGMGTRGNAPLCRLTAWTGRHLPEYAQLYPLLQRVAEGLAEHVPDRHRAQLAQAELTHPGWVVPGTPFTTVTVNNSYATGVHTDKGDLEAGFSTLACMRRGGPYTGGQLVFPEYRVAVDMQDGDVLLMDAHEYHGNAALVCGCDPRPMLGLCPTCSAERISVVSYFRTRMVACDTPEAELAKAQGQEARG